MLSTVLIGNSHTFVREGRMVTPRGYANKYDLDSHAAHDGEKPGRSLSTGLLGWLDELQASTDDVATLAMRFGLPADYIRAVLAEPAQPVEEAAEGEA
jgi:precorrin-3B C17-methyltransferase